jgi:hypothetical protein
MHAHFIEISYLGKNTQRCVVWLLLPDGLSYTLIRTHTQITCFLNWTFKKIRNCRIALRKYISMSINNVTLLRAILNFTPGPQECTSPLMNLTPRGEICPLGGMFTPSFTPRGEHTILFIRMEVRTENFTPRGQNSPLGTASPPGSKFAKLRMGLWPTQNTQKYICLTHFSISWFRKWLQNEKWRLSKIFFPVARLATISVLRHLCVHVYNIWWNSNFDKELGGKTPQQLYLQTPWDMFV